MTNNEPPYDDDSALTAYLFDNYRHLMTADEKLAEKAVLRGMKLESVGWLSAQRLRQQWGSEIEPDTDDVLADGVDAFRQRVRERIMRDSADELDVNRCPSCSRIVRTPLARQCLWCGHDWH